MTETLKDACSYGKPCLLMYGNVRNGSAPGKRRACSGSHFNVRTARVVKATMSQSSTCEVQIDRRLVSCPACGGRSFTQLLSEEEVADEGRWLREFHRKRLGHSDEKDVAEFTQSEATQVVTCNGCDTVLRNPQPTPESVRALYEEDSYGARALEQLRDNQLDFFRSKAHDLPLGPGAKVLEVGSFVGAFLEASRELGWKALGVDIGEETASFCKSKGLHVIRGDFLNIDLETGWDAITIWNTFDQLPQPKEVLDRCRFLLRSGGLLVLRVPNGSFKQICAETQKVSKERRRRRIMRAEVYGNMLTFPYLAGYTPRSLSHLLQTHHFSCERVLPDNIVRLTSADAPEWVWEEEQRVKRAITRACGLLHERTGSVTHPWFDLWARRGSE
ncbi:MAG TPA: methyltransferase domain-containing protein [Fimbriimonadaceae bacterium]|nr:methyltransferase domain-containing protein [Fimbriimonadaceae bacterium]